MQEVHARGGLLAALTRLFLRRPAAVPPQRHRVAIIVPLSSRPDLQPDEETSLRQLIHHLGHHDKFFIAPAGSSFSRPGFATVEMPRKFFGSAAAHNHLLLFRPFYEAFRQYEYILIYHLDSLVFSDQLLRWCDEGWDYIGAPWLPSKDTPWVREARVGNGGFTLMKIDTVLDVLYRRHYLDPRTFWADLVTRNQKVLKPLLATLRGINRLLPDWRVVATAVTHWEVSLDPARHGSNNDVFWSYDAVRYVPGFRLAPVEDGLRFAFEAVPSQCFEMIARQLPFGCHAWAKFDREFWTPHIVPAPQTVSRDSARRDSAAHHVPAVATR
jgi:uncharacterized protein DUF5672